MEARLEQPGFFRERYRMAASESEFELNDLGQKIGPVVTNWTPAKRPPRTTMYGRFCRVEPLEVEKHGPDLYEANRLDTTGANWTYLGYGPFSDYAAFRDWVASVVSVDDPLFFAIVDLASGKAVGVASYLRIDTANGVIETGHLNYSPRLQRHPAATEAMFLLMMRVFDELGYRRYEWKCHALNEPSSAAALRLGFTYEGCFRQAVVTKGRNRDTKWYSILDSEWPQLKTAYQAWLSPDNFDVQSRQVRSLASLIAVERQRSK
jgi:RimJ/RimL family protein N-acetyltransferase